MFGSKIIMKLPENLIPTLQSVKRVLVLTGAGMSAESGVPIFRDAQQGLWAKYRPEDLATPEAFQRNPTTVWNWYCERRQNIRSVAPHAGHHALVELASFFEAFNIVTQNVDSLHQQAGSRDVIELHGNIMRSICSVTGRTIDDQWISEHPGNPPSSPHDPNGLARPGVVWFGETLPEQAMERALALAAECDACFSIGTSSLVQPAASIPYYARRSGACVIEINPEPTTLSALADYSLQATAAEALTHISRQLKHAN
jgi:NAD-dependent deacetylase